MDPHELKCERLAAQLAEVRARGGGVRLAKSTSNLFRQRDRGGGRLDVQDLDAVLEVDAAGRVADVEGMASYDAVVDATLAQGMLPAVVPQLKSITVGGAVSGVGIESSSFRYGLVHETVEEMEILLGDGRIVRCSRAENPDLFFGFANSYGTLGYALRLKIRLIPAGRYVRLSHIRFTDPAAFFDGVTLQCGQAALDYVDGVVFGTGEMTITTGKFCEDARAVSDYTWMKMFYRSVRAKREDWLTARDYIWRWDTDWFWCSKNLYAQNPLVRLMAGRRFLNSRTYQRVMRWWQRVMPGGERWESVIQDVDIPVTRAAEFLEFLLWEIGIAPIWICPFRAAEAGARFDLYAFDPAVLYINFGFWDAVRAEEAPGWFNRKVEAELVRLGGKKGLYSSVWFDEDTFWQVYNGERYRELKKKWDPGNCLPGLYEKCIKR